MIVSVKARLAYSPFRDGYTPIETAYVNAWPGNRLDVAWDANVVTVREYVRGEWDLRAVWPLERLVDVQAFSQTEEGGSA